MIATVKEIGEVLANETLEGLRRRMREISPTTKVNQAILALLASEVSRKEAILDETKKIDFLGGSELWAKATEARYNGQALCLARALNTQGVATSRNKKRNERRKKVKLGKRRMEEAANQPSPQMEEAEEEVMEAFDGEAMEEAILEIDAAELVAAEDFTVEAEVLLEADGQSSSQ